MERKHKPATGCFFKPNIKRKWFFQGEIWQIQRSFMNKRETDSGFFEEAVLLQGFVFEGPRGSRESAGLVVFDGTVDFFFL